MLHRKINKKRNIIFKFNDVRLHNAPSIPCMKYMSKQQARNDIETDAHNQQWKPDQEGKYRKLNIMISNLYMYLRKADKAFNHKIL